MVTWLLVAAVFIFVPFAFVRWKRENLEASTETVKAEDSMETIKIEKGTKFPLFLGILDAIGVLLYCILVLKEGESLLAQVLLLKAGVTLLLSFFLGKSNGACIAMIGLGLYRNSWYAVIFHYFGTGMEEKTLASLRDWSRVINASGWIPVLAGVLGLLTMYWMKKMSHLPTEERRALITRRSVFTVVSAFYLMILVAFVGGGVNYYYEPGYGVIYINQGNLGDGIYAFCRLFELIGETFKLEVLADVFEYELVCRWCFALLPSYLIYLGVHHPFSKKSGTSLCVIGTALTLLTSICEMRAIDASGSEDEKWMHLLLVGISLVCILVGYFYLCKKLPEWSYILVGCGFLIYAPIILLAVLLAVCYFILKAMGKVGSGSSSKKKWEVTDGGATYIIEEGPNGTYFDDCNREWKTDDGGNTFYRKE